MVYCGLSRRHRLSGSQDSSHQEVIIFAVYNSFTPKTQTVIVVVVVTDGCDANDGSDGSDGSQLVL